jgi:hypothetical protein
MAKDNKISYLKTASKMVTVKIVDGKQNGCYL